MSRKKPRHFPIPFLSVGGEVPHVPMLYVYVERTDGKKRKLRRYHTNWVGRVCRHRAAGDPEELKAGKAYKQKHGTGVWFDAKGTYKGYACAEIHFDGATDLKPDDLHDLTLARRDGRLLVQLPAPQPPVATFRPVQLGLLFLADRSGAAGLLGSEGIAALDLPKHRSAIKALLGELVLDATAGTDPGAATCLGGPAPPEREDWRHFGKLIQWRIENGVVHRSHSGLIAFLDGHAPDQLTRERNQLWSLKKKVAPEDGSGGHDAARHDEYVKGVRKALGVLEAAALEPEIRKVKDWAKQRGVPLDDLDKVAKNDCYEGHEKVEAMKAYAVFYDAAHSPNRLFPDAVRKRFDPGGHSVGPKDFELLPPALLQGKLRVERLRPKGLGGGVAVYERDWNTIWICEAGIDLDSPIDRAYLMHEGAHAVQDARKQNHTRFEAEIGGHGTWSDYFLHEYGAVTETRIGGRPETKLNFQKYHELVDGVAGEKRGVSVPDRFWVATQFCAAAQKNIEDGSFKLNGNQLVLLSETRDEYISRDVTAERPISKAVYWALEDQKDATEVGQTITGLAGVDGTWSAWYAPLAAKANSKKVDEILKEYAKTSQKDGFVQTEQPRWVKKRRWQYRVVGPTLPELCADFHDGATTHPLRDAMQKQGLGEGVYSHLWWGASTESLWAAVASAIERAAAAFVPETGSAGQDAPPQNESLLTAAAFTFATSHWIYDFHLNPIEDRVASWWSSLPASLKTRLTGHGGVAKLDAYAASDKQLDRWLAQKRLQAVESALLLLFKGLGASVDVQARAQKRPYEEKDALAAGCCASLLAYAEKPAFERTQAADKKNPWKNRVVTVRLFEKAKPEPGAEKRKPAGPRTTYKTVPIHKATLVACQRTAPVGGAPERFYAIVLVTPGKAIE